MASKRVLYQPAPITTTVGGDKKTRRPLVQGRLVTQTEPYNNRDANMVQGQLVIHGELEDDPTLQPVNALPTLTENMSPPPEPLHSLDLSDTDIDTTEDSRVSRPKPVLVLDASRQGDLPYGTELEVVVAYEDSPARVICHTPGKLERSLLEEWRTVRGLDYSSGDGSNCFVKMDRVQYVSELTPISDKRSQNPLLGGSLKKMKDAKNRSHDESPSYISNPSRGIIEEILAQELGNSNIHAISLHSETSPLSPQLLTHSTTSSDKSQQRDKNRYPEVLSPSHEGDLMTGSPVVSGPSRTKHKNKNVDFKSATSSFPQPNFEDESDASTDRVPVKQNTQRQQTKTFDDYSDSETCSLQEYVTPNKSKCNKVDFNNKVAVASKSGQETGQTEVSLSVKKRKMRKVPSRYMLMSANKTSATLSKSGISEQHLSKPGLRPQTLATATNKPPRENHHVDAKTDIASKKPISGRSSKMKVLPTRAAKTKTHQAVVVPAAAAESFVRSDSPQEVLRSSERSNKEQKTSTPTHDQTCHLSQDIDASAIHSVSAMSINMSLASAALFGLSNKGVVDGHLKNLIPEKLSSQRHVNRLATSQAMSGPSDMSQLQLDLTYSRYLQWAFLNSKAKNMLQDQEKDALAQLHGLWRLVESKRGENTLLKMDVSRLTRMNLLDNILDKTELELDSLTSVIPQLEEHYSKLSSALDSTRHQLPTRDIYIPQGGQEEKDVYEEKLETALKESEQLLVELSDLTGDKMVPLSQLLNSVEAIDRNVSATYQELQASQAEVTSLQALTTRLTSLCVQDMQV